MAVGSGKVVTAVGMAELGLPVTSGWEVELDSVVETSLAVELAELSVTLDDGGTIEVPLRNEVTEMMSPGTAVTTVDSGDGWTIELATEAVSFCPSCLLHFGTDAADWGGVRRGPASAAANKRAYSANGVEVCISPGDSRM